MELVTAQQMRALDRMTIERGTPGEVLMERAGEGAFQALLELFPHVRRKGARVLVVAGKGNNGGDGFVIARLLRKSGVRTTVALLASAEDVGGDALHHLKAYRRGRAPLREVLSQEDLSSLAPEMEKAALVVDALLGTGLRSDVRGLYADAIHLMNACGRPVFAVDVPSGLDSDTGQPHGTAVQAEATATFGLAKLGQVQHPGAPYCGSLVVVDIGIAEEALEESPPAAALLDGPSMAPLIPRRMTDSHKGTHGHLLLIAGSLGKVGASILAARASLRGGAGLLTVAGPESVNPVCAGAVPEAMTVPWRERDGELAADRERLRDVLSGKAAVAAGPGLGTGAGVRNTIRALLREYGGALVLDADALNVVATDTAMLKSAVGSVVLTPHPGEMSRLLGSDTATVQADRVGVARTFAAEHGCVVVLKGAATVIAEPAGFVWINSTGNPGMACGGMGDALAGLIGAFVAQGLAPAAAARLGAYVHGLAGDRAAEGGMIGMTPSDLIEQIPAAIAEVDGQLSA